MSATARIAELESALAAAQTQVAERDQVAHDLQVEADDLRVKLTAALSRIERMSKRLYGWSSERHHPAQQAIDLGLPTVALEAANTPTADVDASESFPAVHPVAPASPADAFVSPEPAPAAAAAPLAAQPVRRRHPGRRRLPEGTEIVEEEVAVPESERLDEDGQPLPLLGWRVSDKWDYRPGAYVVRRYRRGIYGRPFSEAQDRVVAMLPTFLIPRGQMTDAAVIHTVVEKFADHLPLYRQAQRAARVGVTLSRATLVNHVAAVARAVEPVVAALADQVRAARHIHLDDMPVRLLEPGRGHTATARIWVYRSRDAAVFRFTTTREGRHPAEFLGDYRGAIVADAYAGHERLYGPDRATAIGCWAHVRRKFHEIHERIPLADRLVADIGGLYAIERDLRVAQADAGERRRARQTRAEPLITAIRQRLDAASLTALPSSDLGRAIAYALKRWPTLTPYLDDGDLPIDNNPAENALRPWAVGRKNWLFLGSCAGGERAAIIATLIENCRMQGIDPYAYLCNTVAAVHAGRTDYAAMTPQATAVARDRGAA